MPSTLDRASMAVASACAVASNFVKVISLDPLKTNPDNLFLMTFTAVGINDGAHVSTFQAALASFVPDAMKGGIQQLGLDPGLQISVVVSMVDALFAQNQATSGAGA